MTPRFWARKDRTSSPRPYARKPRFFRLGIEPLEDRLAPSAGLPPDLIVGRTQSAYSTVDVANNSLSVTYTVYNQRADDITGVLLTTSLQPGVTFTGATQPTDRDGSTLAWGLGTISGYGRASVTVTMAIPAGAAITLDSGARAFGTLDGGVVAADTPAASLTDRLLPATFLTSTPDANTADPFVQEQAARLRYDPQAIFDYLNDDVGYESYTGSLRGARGTLWSEAGNSLDEASLGVALFRASGIPARYARGTLSTPLASQLVLTMFPSHFQTVGHIPDGAAVADPANDPRLLAETRDHFWVQFDAGSGFQNADSSGLPGGGIGTAFTVATETFGEVADGLRHRIDVTLDAETYNSASGLFGGLAGDGLSTSTVLTHTFSAVELVGKPISIGALVNQTSLGGLVFSSRTTTYSPYLIVGDLGLSPSEQAEPITGTTFQDFVTNFPFGSSVLTGLFLKLGLRGPGSPTQTFERALVDRIGFATRQGQGGSVSVDPTGPPPLTTSDVFTINASAAKTSPAAARLAWDFATRERLAAEANPNPATQTSALIATARAILAEFADLSDRHAANLAHGYGLAAYYDAPRLTLFSSTLTGTGESATLAFRMDLIRDAIRAVATPGQNLLAANGFAAVRGIFNSFLEAQMLPVVEGGTNTSSMFVVQEAIRQGIPLLTFGPDNLADLATLDLPAEAKARITVNVQNGLMVSVPIRPVTMGGAPRVAWLVGNPESGEILSQAQDGANQGLSEFVMGIAFGILNAVITTAFLQAIPNRPPPTNLNIVKSFALGFVVGLVVPFGILSLLAGVALLYIDSPLGPLSKFDPPLSPLLVDLDVPHPDAPGSLGTSHVTIAANTPAGPVTATLQAPTASLSGPLTVTWAGDSVFTASSVNAATATVTDASGAVLGSGPITFSTPELATVTVTGPAVISVSGTGSVSSYGGAFSSLGLVGDWADFTASLTGDATLKVTTNRLTLNGLTLPAGTYRVRTSAATIGGRGRSNAPAFVGSATVTTANATVTLSSNPGTYTGFSGSIALTSGGTSDADDLTVTGMAGHILRARTDATGLTADQNTPVTFDVRIDTSRSDTYAVEAEAPAGWAVTVDATGRVSATPAPGLEPGAYSIRVTVRSLANEDLVTSFTVPVTVTAVAPGIEFAVDHDPIYTVPFAGAQIPSAYRATVRNLGPAAEVLTLTFANVPPGFRLLNSGTSFTVPAGTTGFLGLYLEPLAGSALPAPGTVLTFDVTATSATNPALTQTRTVTFSMPEVHGVTLVATPAAVGATPGTVSNATVTLTAVGNVAETVSLSSVATAGLIVTGLPASVTLTPGQSLTLPVTLAVSETTSLNTNLQVIVTATVGPATTPVTQTLRLPIRVVVPGADAIVTASSAAEQLDNTDLANRLRDLSTALTNLVQSPINDVARSTSLAALDAVIGLVGADAYLSPLVASLTNDRAALGVATTATTVHSAVSSLGATLEDVGQTLADAVAHRFTLAFVNNTGVAQPLVPNEFTILLRNTGTQTTTYDLTALGVPAGVTVSFSHTSVTLAPGQSTFSAGVPPLTVTLTPGSTELTPFAFEVRAVARPAPAIAQSISGSLSVRSEVVTVVSVSPTPAFADPGVPVAVSARLLNAVNREQVATVQYTVRNAGGTAVFTSAPVSANLTVLTSLSTVPLGTLDTTGFALGNYTITVTVSDDTGNPIPGATGTGHLLVGSPVTASLSIDPTALPPGTGTVTNTLVIDAQGASVGPLGVVSLTELPGAGGVVRHGHYVYASGTAGIGVYDVADPANPQLIRTFGSHANTLEIRGDKLYALAFGGPFGRFPLTIYSLTDPENPQLLGASTFNGQDGIPYSLAWNMVVTETHVFVSVWSTTHLIGGQNDIRFQTGDVLAFDVSDPTAPVFVSALLNTYGTNNDGIGQFLNVDVSGGDGNLWEIVQVDANTLLVAGSTARGDDTQTGNGVVHVIDISNPAQMTIVRTLVIPGTVQAVGLSIEGNRAFVAGSQGGWNDPAPTGQGDFTGNLVLATLDISAPRNPMLLDSEILNRSSWGPYSLRTAPLGNGRFALSSQGNPQDQPVLFVVDANDPANLVTSQTTIPTATANLDGVGNFIYATSPSGLIIYQLDAADAIPATARVTVSTADGVAVVPGSFSLAPTRTLPAVGGTTYEWDLSLSGATTTITWQSTVAGVQPGRSRTVASNGSVSFVSQGTAGEVEVADQFVAGVQILGLTPASQTAAPGDAVTFGVVLENPTGASVTYSLGVTGVPGGWVDLAASAIVPANGSVTVPLTLTANAFAALAAYGLTITATASSVTSSVRGTLTLAGTPMLPDPQSHGVVVSLTPTNAIAGPGTTAVFIVRVTNTGSATETYDLTTSLPAGVAGILSQTSVTVPPGVGNFREVTLRLTPAAGTTPGDFNVSVNAIAGAVSDFAEALLTVVNRGVTVSLDRTFLAPGETATATITNTGSVADSFDLSLTGPAGLVSTLGVNRIDLAPGESRTVTVTTNSTVPFAVAGAMPLSVVSQSVGNPAVRGAASTNVMVPQSVGLTAAFRQASRIIVAPGTADFTLDVSNLGTGEDAYEATIIGSTGRVTAVLIGLNGQPASSIPTFRLPGLSQGAITVRANLADIGSGTVTIRIRSLSDPTRESVRIATLGTTSPTRPTPLVVGGATTGTAIVYSPVSGQFGPGTPLTFFPGFAGDVRTATADVTGDGIDDFIGGSGPGLAEVAIVDGATLQIIARFNPFESSFTLGLYVAAADLNGDGKADVVVTPDLGGGPVVAVYDGTKLSAGLANGQGFGQPAQIVRYYGIEGDPNFRGGARPSLGDVDGDGTPDLMVSAGFLGGPRIALLNGVDVAAGDDTPRHLIPDFYAFEPTLRNGAFVALGDITGDGRAELVFGGGPTGGNRVRVFDAAAVLAAPGFESLDQLPAAAQLNNFFTGDPSLRGGARVAVKYIDDSGKAALITGSGNDERARVQVYSSTLLLASPTPAAPDQVIEPFDLILANGAFVG